MLHMIKTLLWIWREPTPPIATYDNTPEKWGRAFQKRRDWLESKPMPGTVENKNISRPTREGLLGQAGRQASSTKRTSLAGR